MSNKNNSDHKYKQFSESCRETELPSFSDKKLINSEEIDENLQSLPNNRRKRVEDENDDYGNRRLRYRNMKKAKNQSQVAMRLLGYTFKHKKLFTIGSIGILINSMRPVIMPYIVGEFIDSISSSKDLKQLTWTCQLFVLAGVIGGIGSFMGSYCFNIIGEKIVMSIKASLYKCFLYKEIEYFDSNKSGSIVSRITSDTKLIEQTASNKLAFLFFDILQLIGSVVLLFKISPTLTLYIFLIVPISSAIIFTFSRFKKKYSKLYQQKLGISNGLATEVVGNMRVVKSFATEKKEFGSYYDTLLNIFEIGKLKALVFGIMSGVFSLVTTFALILILWKGGNMCIEGELTVGELSTIFMYTVTLTAGIAGFGHHVNEIAPALAVSEEIFELIDTVPKIVSGGFIPSSSKNSENALSGEIILENVQFSYPSKSTVKALNNINLTIQKGSNVAIVGQSGSGKSTIVALLERFYDVTGGKICLDGRNLKDYDIEWLHQKIGYVSQEPTLFSGSLKDNIVYGLDRYTDEDIQRAIKQANAYDFISDSKQFPDNIETIVGERGVKLSGGQKQRIAIARALIKNPKILIFDEATSALDAESEFQVQSAIDGLVGQGNITIIIIAHRLSTIRNCDKIVVLKEGDIVEEGKHFDLVKQDGYYKKLIERQLCQTFEDKDI